MSWRNTRYTSRPAAKNKAARVAWDELSRRAAQMDPPRTIQTLWCATEMEQWCAYLNEIDANEKSPYLDMDVLEVRDRLNNSHKYAANDEPRPGANVLQFKKEMSGG